MDLGALGRAAPPETVRSVYSAQVVRADASGLWVVEIGEDPRHPVGPCRGGWTANGTRVPPGALVVLLETEDGPWVLGVDNPALAIPDAEGAPFDNPSFESVYPGGIPGGGSSAIVPAWNDFWSLTRRGPGPSKYDVAIDTSGGAHGANSLHITARGTYANVGASPAWTVPAGSSLEVIVYARATGDDPYVDPILYSSNPAAGGSMSPGPFSAGTLTSSVRLYPTTDGAWVRYRNVITIPSTHTRVALLNSIGTDDPSGVADIWVDGFDVNVVNINPATAHQDYMRRAALVLLGGGTRTVTAGGNVSWSQPFTIAGAGMEALEAPDGRFAITMPPNGTVIPVHSSGARVSHTVAGGVIALNADDALWYELPIAAAATSQPARFHIVGSSAADGFVVPPHWILVVRRASAWSPTSYALEYRWGDGRHQDAVRTPSLNAGWIAGTLAPTFRKTADDLVIMRGRVRNGAGSAFTLPAGYWPSVTHEAYVRDGAGASALITVSTAGVVTTAGNNTDHSIATSFVADQP